jgi:phosphoribosylglycinamide formyltransferase-1
VDEGLDTGQVIGKREVDLRGASSLEEVERRGLAVEHSFYSQCLKQVFAQT